MITRRRVMRMVDDGYDPYMLDSDGKKHLPKSTEVSINGERVFHFDSDTGVLRLSADSASIEDLVGLLGGYPIAEFILHLRPFGKHYFQNISAIQSLPKKDGSFFIKTS